MIVDDYLNDGNVVSARCGKFVHIHSEASVTRDIDTNLIRLADLRTDTCTKAVSHGSETAGGKEGARLCIPIILCRPHLMLSDICRNQCLTVCNPINFFYNVRPGKNILIVIKRISFL